MWHRLSQCWKFRVELPCFLTNGRQMDCLYRHLVTNSQICTNFSFKYFLRINSQRRPFCRWHSCQIQSQWQVRCEGTGKWEWLVTHTHTHTHTYMYIYNDNNNTIIRTTVIQISVQPNSWHSLISLVWQPEVTRIQCFHSNMYSKPSDLSPIVMRHITNKRVLLISKLIYHSSAPISLLHSFAFIPPLLLLLSRTVWTCPWGIPTITHSLGEWSAQTYTRTTLRA